MTQQIDRNPDGAMPEDNIIMSIHGHDKIPKAPDTMEGYRDDEKELANQVQGQRASERRFGHGPFLAIGGGVLSVLAAGGIILGVNNGNNKAPDEPRETTSSAPATPTPEAKKTVDIENMSASELVGVPNTKSLDTVNTRPTQELIDQAEQGVSAEKYPDPRNAYKQLVNLRNMLDLSAKVDVATRNPDGLYQDTDESLETRTNILHQIYTDSTINNPDTDLSVEMDFGNVIAMDLDAIDVEIGKTEVKPTWREDTKVISVESSDDKTEATIYSQDGALSNMQDPSLLGEEAFQNLLSFEPNKYYAATTEIRVDDDGNWRIVSQQTDN